MKSGESLLRGSGHFGWAGVTGAIAAGMAANGELVQFRWTSSAFLARITEISITGLRATTAFAAGAIDIKATVARAFTAAGTGGGTSTMTGDNNKLRTSLNTSVVGEIRLATTAALGAGTKTLDAQDIGNIITHSSGGVSAATPIIGSLYLPTTELYRAFPGDGELPLILAQNEGVVVRATVPGTGVWNLGVRIRWAELLP